MPNHCYQQVFLEGQTELIRELYNSLAYVQPQFLQTIMPTPIELFTSKDWSVYDWRVENWGTKWEVAEVEITDTSWDYSGNIMPSYLIGDKTKEVLQNNTTSTINFNCWTAWGPPTPVWNKLKDLGVFVDADYQDEGGMFEGTWLDGVNDSWNPDDGEDVEDDNN